MADDEIELSCCQKFGAGLNNFLKFLYNNETGQVMGRSGSSWAKIGFFYLIFYGFLAGFFSGMLAVFLSTLEDPAGPNGPKLTQYVANQPGLSRLDGNEVAIKLPYNSDDYGGNKSAKYGDTIQKFLNKYSEGIFQGKSLCGVSDAVKAKGEAVCRFDTSLLQNCSGTNDKSFGLESNKPCFFIRMNKVFNWVPEGDSGYLKLKCEADSGEVDVYPKGGFLISAFPFRGQKGFELPVVAVQIRTGNPTKIDCSLEGKNIEVSSSWVPSRAFGNIRIK